MHLVTRLRTLRFGSKARVVAVAAALVVLAAACVPNFAGGSTLTVKGVSATSVNLIWNPAYDSDAGDAMFYYSIAVNGTASAAVFAPATNCTLQGLQPSTHYTFDVTGVNVHGQSSAELTGGAAQFGHLSASFTTPAGSPSGVGISCANTAGGTDTDGDRLPDWAETNTHVYLNPGNTGTSPSNADTDGDGIKDGDEVLGTLQGLPLNALGAKPLRKDIFVEADWMDSSLDCNFSYSMQPTAFEVNRVKNAFATAPVSNPDGSTGIDFIMDYGQGLPFKGGNKVAGNGAITGDVTTGNDASFNAIKAANFAANRNGYFHYLLMGAEYSTFPGSSGIAELPGDDFIVTLPPCALLNLTQNPSVTNADEVANTIMHELGHNLGLHHGGSNDVNYKFNFNSVMNYWFQGDGIDTNCDAFGDNVLSYSTGSRIALNELSLNEANGVCGAGFPIDWNGSGTITSGLAIDLNQDGVFQTLTDFNDWSHLSFGGLTEADGARARPTWVVEQPASTR
jgi:Fibronectin type III domain